MNNQQAIHDRQVLLWLLTGCLLIALMVVVGGATRLTDSGLSMVDWKPLLGAIPPLSEAEWVSKFEAYKRIPEYSLYHSHFSLEDFKGIFWWEYLHRLLGRVLGIVFLVPFVCFVFLGRFRPGFAAKSFVLFILGGFQGVLGWYMVKSGLVDNPDVSHYRLALHLSIAFVLYGYAFWLVLSLLFDSGDEPREESLLQWGTAFFLVLFGLQVVWGAFVAGLKAGRLFPTFPKMGNDWIPTQVFTSFQEMGVVSLASDMVSVQLVHRVLGVLDFLAVCGLLVLVLKRYSASTVRAAAWSLFAATLVQVGLGIGTLVYHLPMILSLLHQIGALIVLTAALFLLHASIVCSPSKDTP